jgi:serine/threonine protein kinase
MDPRNALHPTHDTLVAFGLGKIDDARQEEVARHLKGCAECRGRVAELSGDSFIDRMRAAQRDQTDEPRKSLSGLSRSIRQGEGGVPPELANHPQYADVRELGKGGMGVVYLAKNKLMDRPEVLKVVNRALLDQPGAYERFLREIRAAARLQHPNVVAAYSALELGELLVFAMEYVPGDDLGKLVKARGPLPVVNACWYAYQAALGLQHAHEKGMVHRDIKPSNLMLLREGKKQTVKILDFGLAKAASDSEHASRELTAQGMMMGTPDYVAPEQSLDATKADIRADVYSLGCTLYCLLAGRPPFTGSGMFELVAAHHDTVATPLDEVRPEVPAGLAAVVAKMMAKGPAERYQTPGEVAQALAPFCKAAPKAKDAPQRDTTSGETFPLPKGPVAAAGLGRAGKRPSRGKGTRRIVYLAAAFALPLLLAGIVLVIKWTNKDGSGKEIELKIGAGGIAPAEKPPAAKVAGGVAAYPHGSGRWQVEGDELVQDNPDADAASILFGNPSWEDYDLTVEVKRVKGDGLFILNFRCQDCANKCQLALDLGRQITSLNYIVARKYHRGGPDVAWAMDDGWHKLTVRLRGQKAECLIDDAVIHSADPIVYRRGYVGLFLSRNTSMRFKNLKIHDKEGRALVNGVRDLDLADRPGSPAAKFEDEAKAGTWWKGKLFVYRGDKLESTMDNYEFHVVTRDGMNFTGEFWAEKRTRGIKVEGRIDAKGDVSYVPTQLLGAGRPLLNAEQLGKWQAATLKGKQFRLMHLNPKEPTHRADLTAIKQD